MKELLIIALMIGLAGYENKTDAMLDLFAKGAVPAHFADEEYEPFYMTDLPSDPEDFTYYSVGEKVDLDNDGEKELIINGPYGGIYLDARDETVYVLDEGMGTTGVISYAQFDNSTWIVHGDTTHGGRILYDFKLYDGTGSVTDSFELDKEYWENPDEPDGPGTVYTYRGEEITREEYETLRMKMLGY